MAKNFIKRALFDLFQQDHIKPLLFALVDTMDSKKIPNLKLLYPHQKKAALDLLSYMGLTDAQLKEEELQQAINKAKDIESRQQWQKAKEQLDKDLAGVRKAFENELKQIQEKKFANIQQ